MALDDLRRKIFQKDERFERRFREPRLGKHSSDADTSWEHEYKSIPEVSPKNASNRKIILIGVLGGIGVLLILFGVFLVLFDFPGIGKNTLDHIDLSVEGGEEIVAGGKVLWKVRFANNNSVRLEDVSLTFEFPETAQPLVGEFSENGLQRETRALGTLEPNESGEEIFSAIVFGSKDAILNGRVSLEYRPQDSSARFSRDTEYSVRVASTLLAIAIDAPDQVQVGQEIELHIKVVSSSESVFRGLWVGLEYPQAFEFIEADFDPDRGDSVWRIGDLAPNADWDVSVRGRMGEHGAPQTFNATVGLYDRVDNVFTAFNEVSKALSIEDPFLAVSVKPVRGELLPGIIKPGSVATFEVNWKNNLPVDISNIKVEVALDGEAFDLRTLDPGRADFNGTNNTLRWVSARIPELTLVKPGVGGMFTFQVGALKRVEQHGVNDKNFFVTFRAGIDSNESPPGYEGVVISGKHEMALKLVTEPSFFQNGYYFNAPVRNQGPLPPRVGEETTYTVVWSLLNTLNDVDNIDVRATIPSNIRWIGPANAGDQSLSFDPSTRELVWRPGILHAATGILRPTKEIAFQIGLTPSVPQIGDRPELVSQAVFEGIDTFTGVPFEIFSPQVTTDIKNDPEAARFDSRVQG